MLIRIGICLIAVAVVLAPLSCAKLPEWAGPGEGDITVEALPEAASIPSEWGNLVSTNFNPHTRYRLNLCFQDQQGTLRMVIYDLRSNQFLPNARLIPRG